MREIVQAELDVLARVANTLPVYRRHTEKVDVPKEPKLWKKGCFGCSHSQGKLSDQGYYTTVWFYPSVTSSIQGVPPNAPFTSFVFNRNDTYFKQFVNEHGWHHWLYSVCGPYSNMYEPAKEIMSKKSFSPSSPSAHSKPPNFYGRIMYHSLTDKYTHKHGRYNIIEQLDMETPYFLVVAATFYGATGSYVDPRLNIQFDQAGLQHIRTHSENKYQIITGGKVSTSNKLLNLEVIVGSKPKATKKVTYKDVKMPAYIDPAVFEQVQHYAASYSNEPTLP